MAINPDTYAARTISAAPRVTFRLAEREPTDRASLLGALYDVYADGINIGSVRKHNATSLWRDNSYWSAHDLLGGTRAGWNSTRRSAARELVSWTLRVQREAAANPAPGEEQN